MTVETFALVCFSVAAYLAIGWVLAFFTLPHDRPGAVLIVMFTWPVVVAVAVVRAMRAEEGKND